MIDHLVIGGGLAGSMVAMRLAAAGRQVTLLDKEHCAHHKICGEFLSPEAVEYLHQVGVNPLDLGAATINFMRLCSKRSVVESALPFKALSLSRFVLDAAMLARAAEMGCDVQRGVLVEQLTTHDNQWCAQLRNGESLRARTVFLATGKHELRGWNRAPAGQQDLVAFKLHWQLERSQTEALREFIELFLFRGGYGGLSLVEGDIANLCLVVRRSVLRKSGGWTELLASIKNQNQHVCQRLRGAKALWDRPLALSSIPYGYLPTYRSGLWCVGDQTAVIPSFTGDGMSIALHSAALAAEMYLAGASTDQYDRVLRSQLNRGMTWATFLSRIMVTGVGRNLAPLGLVLCPHAMQWIAAATRVPQQSLLADPASFSKNDKVSEANKQTHIRIE